MFLNHIKYIEKKEKVIGHVTDDVEFFSSGPVEK